MTHKFESGFFVHKAAWHGLGTVLNNPPTTEEAIVKSGLNWRVIEEPLYKVEPVEDDRSETVLCKKLVRDRDRRVLGTVKHDYVPLQNEDAFRWFDPLLDRGGIQLETAGSLKGGQRIWILAKLVNTEADIAIGDPVRPYLLLHNSHDGSTAAWIQFAPIRVVCWNTLSGATANRFGDLWRKKAICIPHALGLQDQLDRIQNILDLTKQEFQYSVEEYRAMASKEINSELLESYMGRVLRLATPSTHQAWQQLVANFEGGLGNQGKTLWDAYNAITEWLDRQREVSAEARLEYSWFGSGALLRDRAHKVALSMVGDSFAQEELKPGRQRYQSMHSASSVL